MPSIGFYYTCLSETSSIQVSILQALNRSADLLPPSSTNIWIPCKLQFHWADQLHLQFLPVIYWTNDILASNLSFICCQAIPTTTVHNFKTDLPGSSKIPQVYNRRNEIVRVSRSLVTTFVIRFEKLCIKHKWFLWLGKCSDVLVTNFSLINPRHQPSVFHLRNFQFNYNWVTRPRLFA